MFPSTLVLNLLAKEDTGRERSPDLLFFCFASPQLLFCEFGEIRHGRRACMDSGVGGGGAKWFVLGFTDMQISSFLIIKK